MMLQDEASQQKKKLARVKLGPTAEDLARWLDSIPQLKKYSMKLSNVTGASICAIASEDALRDLGTVARKSRCSCEFLAHCVGI